jgi:hypothetical protein
MLDSSLTKSYHDLTGLPPTPEQLYDFLNDHEPDAYERLVDRLLASPHFGVRRGRHWLDIVRFAESTTLRGLIYEKLGVFVHDVIDSRSRTVVNQTDSRTYCGRPTSHSLDRR